MSVVGYRHTAYDSPWWAVPSSRGGRYHAADLDTIQYLCLHPLGPAAEMLRHNVGPAGDPDGLVLNLWAARIDTTNIARVDFGDCGAYGITADELVGDNYAATRQFAEAVRATGVDGMIVPSAALPGTHNAVLFGTRLLLPYLHQPLDPEQVPTGHLTDGARPPAEVHGLVRWFGDPHVALEVWKASGSYPLLEDPLAARY